MKTHFHSAATRFRVVQGKHFKLSYFNPADKVDGFPEKKEKEILKKGLQELRELQDVLYADNSWGVLLVFQGMDTSGKDGTIKHVMRGLNPQGCVVHSFKNPSAEDLAHDYLWRCVKRLPERGQIGIFNRSYYEEVLIVRVHPKILNSQRLPAACLGDAALKPDGKDAKRLWSERFEDIVNFERHLSRNGIKVVKFFLNISHDEQRKRLVSRLDEKDKNWKFSMGDLAEREYWKDYQQAYEEMIRHTATPDAPWHVIPANDKSRAHYVVGAVVLETLRSLKLAYPTVSPEQMKELEKAKKALVRK